MESETKELIENYAFIDYEKSQKIVNERYEVLSFLCEKLPKINSYLEKFIKSTMENKILKTKLSSSNQKENEDFYSLFLLIQKTIETTFNETFQMINEILEPLINLKDDLKSSFKEYEDFIEYQKEFKNKLVDLEEYKKSFLESAQKAELYTYEFLKKKVFDIKVEPKDFNEKQNLKNIVKEELSKYKSKINEVNQDLKIYNEKQKKIYKIDKELDINYLTNYSDSLMTYCEHQSEISELSKKIKDNIVNLNNENNSEKLKDLLNKYKQKDEIEFVQYESQINFESCKDLLELNVCFMAFNEMKGIIGNYKDINLDEEKEKMELSEKFDRILVLDDKLKEEDNDVLLGLLKNDLGQEVFITTLSKLRANGEYKKSNNFINLVLKAFNIILESAEKEKDYEKAKNCIILSQTYFNYINGEKTYIFSLLKNNKWLKTCDFWRSFINFMIKREFEHKTNLSKKKLNDILLTQLLPHVNNMKGFGIDNRLIVKIIDEILEKYNYLNEQSYNSLFTILNLDLKEIEKYRKEYKENPDLENQLSNDGETKNYNNNKDIKMEKK